jgi:hypothetical protein
MPGFKEKRRRYPQKASQKSSKSDSNDKEEVKSEGRLSGQYLTQFPTAESSTAIDTQTFQKHKRFPDERDLPLRDGSLKTQQSL